MNVAQALRDYDTFSAQMGPLVPAEASLAQLQSQLGALRQQISGTQQSLSAVTKQEAQHEAKLNNLEHGTFRFLVMNRHSKEAATTQAIAQEKQQIAQLQARFAQEQQQEAALRQQEASLLQAVQQLQTLRQNQQAAFLAVCNASPSPQLQQLQQQVAIDGQNAQAEQMFATQLEALLPYYRNALQHYAAAMQLEMRAERSNMTDVMFENSYSEYSRDMRMQQARQLAGQASAELINVSNALPPRLFQVNPQLGNMLRQVPVVNLSANNFAMDLVMDEFGRGADLMNDMMTEQRLQQNMMMIRQVEMNCQQHMAALTQFIGQVRAQVVNLQARARATNDTLHAERIRTFEAARVANGVPAPANTRPPTAIPTEQPGAASNQNGAVQPQPGQNPPYGGQYDAKPPAY